jgi:hypothetical protein
MQIGPQRSGEFGNGIGVLVVHRHDGELVSLTDPVREIFDDVEDAARRLRIPSASHSLAKNVHQELMPGS